MDGIHLNDGVRLNIRPFMSVPDVGKKGAGVPETSRISNGTKIGDKMLRLLLGITWASYDGKKGRSD